MGDVLYVATSIAFFTLMFAFLYLYDRSGRNGGYDTSGGIEEPDNQAAHGPSRI